ncbi:MAG: hypothetical protein AAF632_24350 [Bacteroidota bacterium]
MLTDCLALSKIRGSVALGFNLFQSSIYPSVQFELQHVDRISGVYHRIRTASGLTHFRFLK